MNPDLLFYGALAAIGLAAGLLGALLGLGGGIFLVPVLTLAMGLSPQQAAGISLVAVVATSTAGASTYVRARLTNIRLALLLAPATVAAAVVASWLAQGLAKEILHVLFAGLLLYAAVNMVRPSPRASTAVTVADAPDPWNLAGSYADRMTGQTVRYQVGRIPQGFAASLVGGFVSGLLGVGGGIVQVPVMNLLMGVPLKVATGTSNFLVGITAVASTFIYYASGRINPLYAVPVALAVFAGARVGAALVQRIPNAQLRRIFAVVAVVVAVLMTLKAAHILP